MLNIWPGLPLITNDISLQISETFGFGNTFGSNATAVSGADRSAALVEWYKIDVTGVAPDSFLGGFSPRLEMLEGSYLSSIPFPGLLKLLLSAPHLAELHLYGIPHSGYFSPDGMVAALSTSTSLESLSLTSASPESCPDLESRRLPPLTRSVLPVLTVLYFKRTL
jgi:hypothetical protein